MNTLSIDFRPFVEWDNSPFILFNEKKKILYLNSAAEILLGYVSKTELYDIALAYAPQSFGYKTTMIDLAYDAFSFYAVTIGYEEETSISIRFYNTPRVKSSIPIDTDKLITTDINILLEANIALFKTKNSNRLQLLADQEIPPFKIDQNNVSRLFRKIFDSFVSSDNIHITLKLLIGEHIVIAEKKESIVQLSIEADKRTSKTDDEIQNLAEQSHIVILFQTQSIKLEIPLIQ